MNFLRIFTVSDIHIDYTENKKWLYDLSNNDYKEDLLILAGDISSRMQSIIKSFVTLKSRFKEVLFIPGNHDLWVDRKNNTRNSLDNFYLIKTIAHNCGILMEPAYFESLLIIPLFGWYDYSFGKPSDIIYDMWLDFTACEWPDGYDEVSVTKKFIKMNEPFLNSTSNFIISFSHFLPRIDVMPSYIPHDKRILYPVLGTSLLEKQIRQLGSNIHIYGHSHVNARVKLDNIEYINNAYGYPSERIITSKKLLRIYDI